LKKYKAVEDSKHGSQNPLWVVTAQGPKTGPADENENEVEVEDKDRV